MPAMAHLGRDNSVTYESFRGTALGTADAMRKHWTQIVKGGSDRRITVPALWALTADDPSVTFVLPLCRERSSAPSNQDFPLNSAEAWARYAKALEDLSSRMEVRPTGWDNTEGKEDKGPHDRLQHFAAWVPGVGEDGVTVKRRR